jgi:hypothetical protein
MDNKKLCYCATLVDPDIVTKPKVEREARGGLLMTQLSIGLARFAVGTGCSVKMTVTQKKLDTILSTTSVIPNFCMVPSEFLLDLSFQLHKPQRLVYDLRGCAEGVACSCLVSVDQRAKPSAFPFTTQHPQSRLHERPRTHYIAR